MTNLEKLVADVHYEINTELKLPRFNPERPAVEELRELAETGLAKRGACRNSLSSKAGPRA